MTHLDSPPPSDTNLRAKAISTEEILYGAGLCMWRGGSGNHLTFIVAKIPCARTGQAVHLS